MDTTTTAPKTATARIETRPDYCTTHGDFEARRLDAAGLPTHQGEGAIIRAVWSGCPACRQEARDKAQALHEAKLKAAQRDLVARRFRDATIPARFAQCTFDAYKVDGAEQLKARDTCKAFAARFANVLERGNSLTLSGPAGTGKTHLGIATLRAVIDAGHTAVYRDAAAAVRYLKATYSAGCDYTEEQALMHLRAPDLLVLDEVGNQHDTHDEKRVLFAIVNARYAHLRPTILLTNLTGAQLKTWAGEAFHDRLLEGGLILPMNWPSHRPKVSTTRKPTP